MECDTNTPEIPARRYSGDCANRGHKVVHLERIKTYIRKQSAPPKWTHDYQLDVLMNTLLKSNL